MLADERDTIYALSSGQGKAGVAVVRVTGPRARSAVVCLCKSVPPARQASLRDVRDPETGSLIDKAVLIWLPGPGNFTGEDTAEFQVHGSMAVVGALLSALEPMPGFRLAEPGEFTQRAFFNGKLDLVRVEGLADLLAAQTKAQLEQAQFHVSGKASEVLDGWRQQMIRLKALVEATIDFSDEAGVEAQARAEFVPAAASLMEEIGRVVEDGRRGQLVRDGVRVALLGAPNVGKSSLLNSISARDVAIVTSEAGTTRDAIEVHLDIEGVPVAIVDTAGIRDGVDSEAERLGIERSIEQAKLADVVVVMDGPDTDSGPLARISKELDSLPIRVWNKCDLKPGPANDQMITVSAKTGAGLDNLVGAIAGRARTLLGSREPALIVRERQLGALRRCLDHLKTAHTDELPMELVAEELRGATFELRRLIGEVDVEDLLGDIFKNFCVGK